MKCSHGYASPKSCVDCMNDGPVEPPKTIRRHHKAIATTSARYDGRCVNCDDSIRDGDIIGIVEDVGWVCDSCFDV